MKIAILSDIHGNLPALEAVVQECKALSVKRYIVAGDNVGYYYDSEKVFDLLTSLNAVMCRGNHEDILQKYNQGDETFKNDIQSRYGSSYELLQSLPDKKMKDVLSLAHPVMVEIDNIRFCISHGAPWDIDAYFYPDAKESDLSHFEDYKSDFDVIVTGHTHYQASWGFDGLRVINPGSVGQPRSGKVQGAERSARAHWALYDTQDKSFEHCETLYDCSALQEQAASINPDLPFLVDVLKRREQAA